MSERPTYDDLVALLRERPPWRVVQNPQDPREQYRRWSTRVQTILEHIDAEPVR